MVWLLWNENTFLKVAFSYGEPKDKNRRESEKREHFFFFFHGDNAFKYSSCVINCGSVKV